MDGRHIAIGHSSGKIYMYNMEDASVKTLQGHRQHVTAIRFLKETNGQFVSGSGAGEVFLWDYEDANIVRKLNGHKSMVT